MGLRIIGRRRGGEEGKVLGIRGLNMVEVQKRLEGSSARWCFFGLHVL